jgi:hypothetical protein
LNGLKREYDGMERIRTNVFENANVWNGMNKANQDAFIRDYILRKVRAGATANLLFSALNIACICCQPDEVYENPVTKEVYVVRKYMVVTTLAGCYGISVQSLPSPPKDPKPVRDKIIEETLKIPGSF